MIDGFLGTRASLMLDFVFLAMFAVIPVLGYSIWLVKCRRKYVLHKRLQLLLGVVLLLAVTTFEVDVRVAEYNGRPWTMRATVAPATEPAAIVFYTLYVHLFFAVTTAVLWVFVIVQALRRFPNPPTPAAYSFRHMRWARLAALDMFLTALTGWIFYWLAFVR
jgi:uncharacterized membrane protein YozB (DUF420 family)